MAEIPIVDFSCFDIGEENQLQSPTEQARTISQEIYNAFTTIGFVYIKNHGIDEEKISNLFKIGEHFFKLPTEIKTQSARPRKDNNHGYVGSGVERSEPSKPGDFREAFNVTEPFNDALPWPVVDGAMFKQTVRDFFHDCQQLSLRLLDLISLGMELKDKTFLRRMHKEMDAGENQTTLRLLYYPAINTELKKNQLRCGEHSDYGTITLLFQDDVGGLQVCNRKGEFVPVTPLKNTILINIGDLMQRWTNDKLISTRHRVLVPEQESLRSIARQSAAFFVDPNDDAMIECLDGSGHYPPITSLDYLNQRFDAAYG